MDDLLGLGAAPAGDALGSDLSGVMDILGSVTASAPAADPMDFSSILGTTSTASTASTANATSTAESEVVDYASPAVEEASGEGDMWA